MWAIIWYIIWAISTIYKTMKCFVLFFCVTSAVCVIEQCILPLHDHLLVMSSYARTYTQRKWHKTQIWRTYALSGRDHQYVQLYISSLHIYTFMVSLHLHPQLTPLSLSCWRTDGKITYAKKNCNITASAKDGSLHNVNYKHTKLTQSPVSSEHATD